MKKYENDIDYKGFNIVVWKEKDKRIFAIGTKEFPNIVFAKQYIDMIKKKENAYQDKNGVYRWKSNDRVPFDDMLEVWGLSPETLAKCKTARNHDDDIFIAEYRKSMENYIPSDEELFEMKSAFGEGTTVINVITGKKIKL